MRAVSVATRPALDTLTAHERAALKKKAARQAARRIVSHLVAGSPKELSDRAQDLLFTMTVQAATGGDFGRYFEPLDLGGKTKSHHSADLSVLTEAGLVERVNRNFVGGRPSWLYRPAVDASALRQAFASEFARLEEVSGQPESPSL
jgi:DNA-binding transcriptional ArsR family regulator